MSPPLIDEDALVLGIETSCDETAASVVRGGREILSNIIASQFDLHSPFGGVVPEIAARAHVERLSLVLDKALREAGVSMREVDGVAATRGPGLIGALLVGFAAGKALSSTLGVPFVGVNHLEGHVFANVLSKDVLEPPFVVLVVSGGHTALFSVRELGTYELLGKTVDDAAGEAFDKVARFLGLGYPGGPAIDRLSKKGDATAIAFPRAMANDGLDFSYAGLKTAVVRYVQKAGEDKVKKADVAASFQEAAVEVQVTKTMRAAEAEGVKRVAVGGGVAANSRLRELLSAAAAERGYDLHIPDMSLCVDNAAMIAAAGHFRLRSGESTPLGASADPNLPLA